MSSLRVSPRVSCASSTVRSSPGRPRSSRNWMGARRSGPQPPPRPSERTCGAVYPPFKSDDSAEAGQKKFASLILWHGTVLGHSGRLFQKLGHLFLALVSKMANTYNTTIGHTIFSLHRRCENNYTMRNLSLLYILSISILGRRNGHQKSVNQGLQRSASIDS